MAARLCVFCRRQPAQPPWEPFCSDRCKLQDLAKWIDGGYCVPAEPMDDGREGARGHGVPARKATRAGRWSPTSDDDENTGDGTDQD